MAVDHDMQAEVLNLEIGALIIATGYKPFDPTPLEQYGYGRFPEVYTSMQFERLNNATGPTDGKIVMKNRVLQTINEKELLFNANHAAKHLLTRLKLKGVEI